MRPISKSIIILLVSLVVQINSISSVYAQKQTYSISGKIIDAEKKPLSYATVFLKNTNYAINTETNGTFKITAIPGTYILCVHLMGYRNFEQKIELNQSVNLGSIQLKTHHYKLNNVEVNGKSIVHQINQTAYNVTAIDAKLLQNNSMNISQALDQISGVKIKQTGGVGSHYQISLNGFSGKHVRVFLDGIPMEGSGTSMQLNKLPINLADHIEVYKGVVPIELGSDALGGAINIVTKKTNHLSVDASYSYGSFNTHSSNISIGQQLKSGLFYHLTFYQNYSDNDYKVKTKLLDLDTNTYSSETYWFKRFHDTYHNEAGIVQIGFRNKKWADHILFETTLSQEHADIQNANLMQIVYGGKKRKAQSIIPALYYSKKNLFTKHLDFSLSAKYNKVKNNNIDTLARQYNWEGNYRIKSSKGESEYSLSEFNNNTAYLVGHANYQINPAQTLSLNHVFSHFRRKTTDDAANQYNSTEATFMKRVSQKNITGLSYQYMKSASWNAVLFGKYYDVKVTGPVDVSTTSTEDYELQNRHFNSFGYGLAGTYKYTPSIQMKISYEKSSRLPTSKELFGDEILETGDVTLKAESSDNLNLNLSTSKTIQQDQNLQLDLGLIYRYTQNYIRRQIEQRYGGAYYTNHGKVETLGADLDFSYFYKKKLFFVTNITYQDIRNKEKYSSTGQSLIYYNDRMPNVPYFFSNTNITYNLDHLIYNDDFLSIGYALHYTHSFYRSWKSEGGDIIIPKQLAHDLTLSYSLKNGRYNFTLEALNFTNEMLFDNYSLQKPGRSFSLKIRYKFNK